MMAALDRWLARLDDDLGELRREQFIAEQHGDRRLRDVLAHLERSFTADRRYVAAVRGAAARETVEMRQRRAEDLAELHRPAVRVIR
jgi:hypothetical protein